MTSLCLSSFLFLDYQVMGCGWIFPWVLLRTYITYIRDAKTKVVRKGATKIKRAQKISFGVETQERVGGITAMGTVEWGGGEGNFAEYCFPKN